MTSAIWVEGIYFNSPVEGWAASIWPASAFPNNPAPGTLLPAQSAPTSYGTLVGVTEFNGLTIGTQYWIAVTDPTVGQIRWFQLPTGRIGNADTDPVLLYMPTANVVPTSDVLLDQCVGSLASIVTSE